MKNIQNQSKKRPLWIPLTQSKRALVDKEDFEKLNKHKWYAMFDRFNWYAVRCEIKINDKRKQIRMHREIMKPDKNMEIDHIDRDGLNNQKKNLRICNHRQNSLNRKIRKDNTSGLRNINWNKRQRKWVVRIIKNGKRINVGVFNSKEKAYEVYKKLS